MKTKIIIFVSLILLTLLLLELPKKYYEIHDHNLLAEQGTGKYETQITKKMSDFSLKLDSFLSYDFSSPTSGIGYTRELTEKETMEVFQTLCEEFELLTAGKTKSLISEMKLSMLKPKCFTAQIFQLRNNEQFIWEVGFLEFWNLSNALRVRMIYDTDNDKIIFFLCTLYNQEDDSVKQFVKEFNTIDYDSIMNYYADYTLKANIEHLAGKNFVSVVIHPFPEPYGYIEEYSLYKDLLDLAYYFWYPNSEPEKIQD